MADSCRACLSSMVLRDNADEALLAAVTLCANAEGALRDAARRRARGGMLVARALKRRLAMLRARADQLLLNAFSTFSQLVMGRIGLSHPASLGWVRDLTKQQQEATGVRVAFWRRSDPARPGDVKRTTQSPRKPSARRPRTAPPRRTRTASPPCHRASCE